MKKFFIYTIPAVFLIILVILLRPSAKEEPFSGTILVGETPITIVKAYSNAEGPINIYADPQKKVPIQARISQYPQPQGLTLQATLQDIQENYKDRPADSFRITQNPKAKNPNITLASVDKNGVYFYLRRIWLPDNTIKEISMMAPTQQGQSFVQADKELSASLDKLTDPTVYTVRPGQTQPDDSPDLSKLKSLLKKPYQPQVNFSKDGTITFVSYASPSQQAAINIIISSPEKDVTDWLKEHIGEYDPVYLFALSNRVAQLGEPVKETIFWGTLARLRGGADRSLCKDRYVGQYLTILQMELLQPALAFYSDDPDAQAFLKDNNLLTQTMREAASWDIQHPQTNSPNWICKSGHNVQNTEIYPQNEWQKRRNEFKKNASASWYK